MDSALLLAGGCVLAFCSPVWGMALLLVLTSTLFHLSQYLTVPLPVGYVEPIEALLLAMIARRLADAALHRPPRRDAARPFDRALASAILPYLAWQTLAAARGAYVWAGTDHFRFGIRFFLNAVLPWAAVFVFIRPSTADRVFRLAFWLALITAGLHIAIQAADYRPIMSAAYLGPFSGREYRFAYEGQQRWIESSGVVRLVPQGINLILFFAVHQLASFAVHRGRRGRLNLAAGGLLCLPVVVSLARSLVFSLAAGLVAAFVFCRVFQARQASVRIAWAALLPIAAVAGYHLVHPGFLEQWKARIEALRGADAAIFDQANRARGRDNIASLKAICDHPVFGVGTSRYLPEYSLRLTPPTDVHPLLQIGLMGGIPAIVLAVRMQLLFVLPLIRRARSDRQAAPGLTPLLAVLVMNGLAVNLIGAGGTLAGNGILFTAIFLSLASRAAAQAAPEPATARPRSPVFVDPCESCT